MYLKISFLNFNFTMICIIHKILVLIKKHLNYFKDNIFECFFRKYNRLSFFLYFFFYNTFSDGKSKVLGRKDI